MPQQAAVLLDKIGHYCKHLLFESEALVILTVLNNNNVQKKGRLHRDLPKEMTKNVVQCQKV